MKRPMLLAIALTACSDRKHASVYETGVPLILNQPSNRPARDLARDPNRRTPISREARTFGDWAVMCEGRTRCTAMSLAPRPDRGDGFELLVVRRADWKSRTNIVIRALDRRPPAEVTLAVGGEVLDAGRLIDGEATFDTVATSAEEIADGRRLLVYDAVRGCEAFCPPGIIVRYLIPKTAAPPVPISLRGARAALGYMDRRLGFTNTPSAVVTTRDE